MAKCKGEDFAGSEVSPPRLLSRISKAKSELVNMVNNTRHDLEISVS